MQCLLIDVLLSIVIHPFPVSNKIHFISQYAFQLLFKLSSQGYIWSHFYNDIDVTFCSSIIFRDRTENPRFF